MHGQLLVNILADYIVNGSLRIVMDGLVLYMGKG